MGRIWVSGTTLHNSIRQNRKEAGILILDFEWVWNSGILGYWDSEYWDSGIVKCLQSNRLFLHILQYTFHKQTKNDKICIDQSILGRI